MTGQSSCRLTGALLLGSALVACRAEPLVEPAAHHTVVATAAVAAPEYIATDLGSLGGAATAAYGINSRGQVVGSSETSDGLTHAFLWEDGAMVDLGTLGGTSSAAHGINAQGHVVGWSQVATGETHAFLWRDGAMTDLGTLGGPHSYAFGINPEDQVVGNAWCSPGCVLAFRWGDGNMSRLTSHSFSIAYSINPRGQVVGQSEQFTSFNRATLWQDGVATNLGLLFTPEHHFVAQSIAFGINAPGHIVGNSDIVGYGGPEHPFVFRGGLMTDLGTLGGDSATAYAINNQGQIAGNSQTVAGIRHAVLWRDGNLIDLAAAVAEIQDLAGTAALAGPRGPGRPERQLIDLALLAGPPADTSVANALFKMVRHSRMAHCCWRETFAGSGDPAASAEDAPSYATDLNDEGTVVGYYYPAGSSAARGVVWSRR